MARQCKVACGLARRRACEREAKREGERRAEELHVGEAKTLAVVGV